MSTDQARVVVDASAVIGMTLDKATQQRMFEQDPEQWLQDNPGTIPPGYYRVELDEGKGDKGG